MRVLGIPSLISLHGRFRGEDTTLFSVSEIFDMDEEACVVVWMRGGDPVVAPEFRDILHCEFA